MARINLRFTTAIVTVLAVTTVFAVRLFDLQVVQASALVSAASHRRTVVHTLYGDRGEITTSDGTVLASSVLRFNVTAAPIVAATFTKRMPTGQSVTVTVEDAMTAIASLTGTTADALEKSIRAHPKANFTYLVKGINDDTARKITALAIPFVYLERSSARSYPDGAVAGNLVGFVGTDGAQAGIEYADNKCLAGKNGSASWQTGADGIQLPGGAQSVTPASSGGTISTTIDADLQYEVQQEIAQQALALGATSATGIVMKVSTGALLAVADYPSVDPNNVNGTNVGNLGSKAFTDLYEPGSTFKSVTASSLLDAGVATPASQATVTSTRQFAWGGSISDAEGHPTERLTLTGVLQNSSNVGMTYFGEKLTAAERETYMQKFGFGAQSAVHFPGEPTAALTPAARWDTRTSYDTMFGQGISTTAVQMASAYQTIANHGVRMPVTLVSSCTAADGTVTQLPATAGQRVISASAADQTVAMLQNVVTSGTLDGMVPIPGYDIAAKTGTAQVADKAGGGYGNNFITSVGGMFPAANPQYVVFVTFTKPTVNKSSAAVAPAFRAITTDVIQKFRIAPETSTEPQFPATW